MTEKELRRFLRRDFAPLSWWLLGYYLIMNAAVVGVMFLHMLLGNPTAQELAGNAWGYLLACAIGMGWLLLWKKPRFWRNQVWEKGKPMEVRAFVCLLVLTIGCQMAASIYGVVLEMLLNLVGLSATTSIESATGGSDTLSMFLYASAGAPIVEELIFRGFVQRSLKPYGRKFAIFGSAVLFGLFHGNLFQSPYAFLVGLVLGYTAMEYSIAWAMLLHMVNNLVLGDMLYRLTMFMPEIFGNMIFFTITGSCAVAAILVLVFNKQKIRGYLGGETMDRRCLRSFFLNWGFFFLALLMAGNMFLMLS